MFMMNGGKMMNKDELENLLPLGIVEHRTAIARMRQLELSNEKESLTLEERKHNICRIDAALEAFDTFLVDFVEMLTSLPDKVQATIPTCTPDQYAEIQSFIDSQLQRLSQKRLYLAIDDTASEKALATQTKEESQKKAAKIKKAKK